MKLKRYFIVLAVALAGVCSLTSCGDDDEDDNNTKQEQTITPSELGSDSKDVIGILGNGTGEALLEAVKNKITSNEQADQLAKTLVEYSKNKANEEWIKQFVEAAASSAAESAQIIATLDNVVTVLEEQLSTRLGDISSSELATLIKEIVNPSTGDGYEGGLATGAQYKGLYDEIYADKLSQIDTNDPIAAMDIFNSLSNDQKVQLAMAIKTYNSKKDDEEWCAGFFMGVANQDEAAALQLQGLFIAFGPIAEAWL